MELHFSQLVSVESCKISLSFTVKTTSNMNMTKLAMVKWCNVRFLCVVVISFNPSSIAMPSRLVPYNAFFLRKG